MMMVMELLRVPILGALLATPLIAPGAAPEEAKEPRPVAASEEEHLPTYGTSFTWQPSIDDAARKARQEGKLLLILHVSGFFENPDST